MDGASFLGEVCGSSHPVNSQLTAGQGLGLTSPDILLPQTFSDTSGLLCAAFTGGHFVMVFWSLRGLL